MRWPTCWCLADLPEELVPLPLATFLDRFPVDPADIARADGTWTVLNLGWLLERCLGEDRPMRSGLLSYRQMLVWRSIESARACTEQRVLPALTTLLESFAERGQQLWPATRARIPVYPAFRS